VTMEVVTQSVNFAVTTARGVNALTLPRTVHPVRRASTLPRMAGVRRPSDDAAWRVAP
jgi:hypothetical protein